MHGEQHVRCSLAACYKNAQFVEMGEIFCIWIESPLW